MPSAGEGWGLDAVPEHFTQVGFAEFPSDIGSPDYSFTLLQKDNDDAYFVGVYVARNQQSCSAGTVELKADLPGLSVCRDGSQFVFASRQGDLAEVAGEALVNAGGSVSVPGYNTIANQSHARIPGFGSLPISPYDTGSVAAYVMDGTGEGGTDQQSIAVGSYVAQPNDLVVLDWWFNGMVDLRAHEDRASYGFPALAASDNEPVPAATLWVEKRGDWIVMVRTTDGVEQSSESILSRVTVVDLGQMSEY